MSSMVDIYLLTYLHIDIVIFSQYRILCFVDIQWIDVYTR